MLFRHIVLIFCCSAITSVAQITVSPNGVNVNHSGPTTVFLSYRGTAEYLPIEAIWCGAVDSSNRPVAGTIFARLPLSYDLSRRSGEGRNLTDIMTIPTSVARKAYQSAQAGAPSSFFYVRRFRHRENGSEVFVQVTCRLAGGGARVPLAITDVNLSFDIDRPVSVFAMDADPPAFKALIHYNGSGRLTGRWEVVMPGDEEPEAFDLLPEASLPIEQRGTQRRYTQLGRFEVFLPPTGQAVIPGPDPAMLPRGAAGAYKIVLRVEATADKEGDSDTGVAKVFSGGVAGFAMPMLRYYLGEGEDVSVVTEGDIAELSLIAPADAGIAQGAVGFLWVGVADASFYDLEIRKGDDLLLRALVRGHETHYLAPDWLGAAAQGVVRWRVKALRADGSVMCKSTWRSLTLGVK